MNLKRIYQTLIVKSFSGALPVLLDEKPNNVIMHLGSNDITKFNYNSINAEELVHRIINIGLQSRSYGVSNIVVSFFKSSHRGCFIKKGDLINFAKFTPAPEFLF